MSAGPSPAGWRAPARRGLAALLVLGLLAMGAPIQALAPPGADPCGRAPEPTEAGPACTDDVHSAQAGAADPRTGGGESGSTPDCGDCPQPCCGGMTLAVTHPQAAVIHTVAIETRSRCDSLPRSIETRRIFHPPRR